MANLFTKCTAQMLDHRDAAKKLLTENSQGDAVKTYVRTKFDLMKTVRQMPDYDPTTLVNYSPEFAGIVQILSENKNFLNLLNTFRAMDTNIRTFMSPRSDEQYVDALKLTLLNGGSDLVKMELERHDKGLSELFNNSKTTKLFLQREAPEVWGRLAERYSSGAAPEETQKPVKRKPRHFTL